MILFDWHYGLCIHSNWISQWLRNNIQITIPLGMRLICIWNTKICLFSYSKYALSIKKLCYIVLFLQQTCPFKPSQMFIPWEEKIKENKNHGINEANDDEDVNDSSNSSRTIQWGHVIVWSGNEFCKIWNLLFGSSFYLLRHSHQKFCHHFWILFQLVKHVDIREVIWKMKRLLTTNNAQL